MNAPTMLRKMGDYIAENGFDPRLRSPDNPKCGCFMHAHREIGGGESLWHTPLPEIVGWSLSEHALATTGWTADATKDAAAACYIAADLAEGMTP